MNNTDNTIQRVIELWNSIPHNYAEIVQLSTYRNMAATLTDSVLQAGMNYKSVVYPRICNILKKYPDYRTTSDFIILFQTIPIEEIIQWKNKRKQKTICELAWFLFDCNINTEDNLSEWIIDDRNAESLLGINGVGRKTIDYLKILSGQQAIPVDRHMYQFLEMAGVLTTDYVEAKIVLRKAAAVIGIEERVLDKTIWRYMSQRSTINQITIFDLFEDNKQGMTIREDKTKLVNTI